MNHALVLDDVAADRMLTTRALKRAGWHVTAVQTSTEAYARLRQDSMTTDPSITIVITDLHMPQDPNQRQAVRVGEAGSHFALYVRTKMERGELPPLPIVALTALSAQEVHLTALAFGCDLVLTKPATSALAEQIRAGLERGGEQDLAGTTAMLHLLRHHLATQTLPDPHHGMTDHDITRALLAYHRQGMVGLGMSQLADCLLPGMAPGVQRGERVHTYLVQALNQVMTLGRTESMTILQRELVDQLTPQEQCARLHISLGEYYKRRRTAIGVLVAFVSTANSERTATDGR